MDPCVLIVTSGGREIARATVEPSAWPGGVTIGSDPRCTIVLAGCAPVAVVLFAWNHRAFWRRVDAADFPVEVPTLPTDGDDDTRAPFAIGPHTVRVRRASETQVRAWIRDPGATGERAIELGELHEVWAAGISIGSDPACAIVLPDLPARAAELHAVSNHRILSVGGEGRRVDHRAFELGGYTLRIEES